MNFSVDVEVELLLFLNPPNVWGSQYQSSRSGRFLLVPAEEGDVGGTLSGSGFLEKMKISCTRC